MFIAFVVVKDNKPLGGILYQKIRKSKLVGLKGQTPLYPPREGGGQWAKVINNKSQLLIFQYFFH
ncbi:hypothetical protein CSQ80_14220 [Cyanobacterium aponinum IPPAS B-1201]|nr:hypothetical protein CSQ80_14220 [Cyanobacterium aponinum IPPAS B-1201]